MDIFCTAGRDLHSAEWQNRTLALQYLNSKARYVRGVGGRERGYTKVE